MLKAQEDVFCLIGEPVVLEMMRYMLLCMLEIVEDGLSLLEVMEAMWTAATYVGDGGG